MKHIAERCVTMLFNAGASYDLGLADTVIQDVEMAGYSTYDFKHREEMFNLGYNARALRLLHKMG